MPGFCRSPPGTWQQLTERRRGCKEKQRLPWRRLSPSSSRPAGMRTGGATGDPVRLECRRRAPPAPWLASCIHAANLNPSRRHRRQSASLPPPHARARGHAGGATGAIPLDRNTGDERTQPGPPAGCLHPCCQSESLPPPSPPKPHPCGHCNTKPD